MSKHMIGIIKVWYPDRGYGFLLGENGRQIFFHVRDWANDDDLVAVNQIVEYEIGFDRRDGLRKKAVNIRLHAGATALAGGQS